MEDLSIFILQLQAVLSFDRINRIFLNCIKENPEIHVDNVLMVVLLSTAPRIGVLLVQFGVFRGPWPNWPLYVPFGHGDEGFRPLLVM